ncbi:MAG: DnaJ family domain-containing protein [Chloroflexota bacterium]
MKQWETGVDIAIRKAMEAGEFNNLPGEGQPLDLNINPHVPADMQLANKIMKENGIAPDWIVQSKTLTAKLDSWQTRLTAAHKAYSKTNNVVAWLTAKEKLTEDAEKLNKEVVVFNLKLPPGLAHRPLLNLRIAIERLSGK